MTVSDDDPTNGTEGENTPAEANDEPSGAEQGDSEFVSDETAEETAQLDLGDDDAALPWLEGDDEEEFESGNSGQLIALLLLGLLAIGLVVGGIWWMSQRSTDPELVADGSVIEAPEEPYKEKPEDPGGKTFEGTGDTSFAVSQGETRPARLGQVAVQQAEVRRAQLPGEELAGATGSAPVNFHMCDSPQTCGNRALLRFPCGWYLRSSVLPDCG